MALPRTRERRRALTASASKLDLDSQSQTKVRTTEAWQSRALTYIDLVPELGYASRFYSRMLKRITIFPATRGPDDKLTPITSGLPVDLLDRIQDAAGGRSKLQGDYGRLQFITGEGYLLGVDLETDDERWMFVWNDEVFREGKDIVWKPDDTTVGTTYKPGQAEAYRMWTPSPRKSALADSPMKSVLDVAEELIILTKAVRATAVSRMINGIVKVPSELSFGPASAIEGDEDPEANIFLRDFIEHITGVVENAGTAEAAAPFIAEGAAEFLEQLSWMKTHDPATDYMERDLRKEAVERLALGLDMPPEVLLGLADSNHWTGRQIVQDTWRSHGAPVAEQFCDDLSEAYLRPALREEDFPNWREVVIGFDDSKVVVSPDTSEDADRAYDRGTIGSKGHRKMKGIEEDLAPTPEEHREWLAIKMRSPEMLGEEFLPPGERGPVPAPPDEDDPEDGPPPPTRGRDVSREESARVIGAAELAVLRCREVAGARLRSHQKAQPDLFENVDGQPNTMVAALLGSENVKKIPGAKDPMLLVSGGTDGFKSLMSGWGYSPSQTDALVEMVHVFAARTLFDQSHPQLPSGLTAHVERMREVTYGALEGA